MNLQGKGSHIVTELIMILPQGDYKGFGERISSMWLGWSRYETEIVCQSHFGQACFGIAPFEQQLSMTSVLHGSFAQDMAARRSNLMSKPIQSRHMIRQMISCTKDSSRGRPLTLLSKQQKRRKATRRIPCTPISMGMMAVMAVHRRVMTHMITAPTTTHMRMPAVVTAQPKAILTATRKTLLPTWQRLPKWLSKNLSVSRLLVSHLSVSHLNRKLHSKLWQRGYSHPVVVGVASEAEQGDIPGTCACVVVGHV